uniref:HEAT repeat protein n=1 Tax=Caenorhabditis japonica TaxID=281687 RepID=A0A8R1EA29_CAEJA
MTTANQVSSLLDLIINLLDTATTYQNQENVRNEVAESLKTIGAHQPNVLLTACHQFLLQNPKLPALKRAFVLQSISICVDDNEVISKLDEQLVMLVINLATQEMNMTKDSDTEWADSAMEVLVTLAKNNRFVSYVVDAILQKFPPGQTTSPHRYIVLTMATIAQHNPFGLVPFLTDILSRTVPLLQHVKTDPLRCAWSRAICSFCEAVRECETERPKEASEELDGAHSRPSSVSGHCQEVSNRATYTDQIEAVYDVVFNWIYSKDPKTRGEAAECVGELCLMIKQVRLIEDVKKIVTNMLPLYRKSYNESHMITQGICRFLEAACVDEMCPLEPYLEDILNALFPNACLDPDDTSVTLGTQAIKNHSEAFRCFDVAATRFADRIVYYLLHKMQNVADSQKLGAINVLRHLLNANGQHMEDKRSLLTMGLKKLLAVENSTSIRVKFYFF